MQKELHTLQFSDLYLCIDGEGEPHFRVSMRGLTKHPDIAVGPEYATDLEKLKQFIIRDTPSDRALVQFGAMRLRLAYINTSSGERWVSLRRVKDKPLPLDKLGFPAALLPHLRKLGSRDGLILICGATGQGKTTTGCSMLSEYMVTHGGVGYTIEDPVEYDLAGRHGETGFCYQVEVRRDAEWAESLVNALRCHPRYIFIGEVCTPDIANQLLRAATSGHVVIATIHAGSIFEGIEGLLQLAEQKIGDRARQLLAAGFSGAIHQTIGNNGANCRFLIADGVGSQSMAIRSMIRDNNIGQIATVVDQQQASLMATGQLFRQGG